MTGTMHVVRVATRDDPRPFAEAANASQYGVNVVRRAWWLRVLRGELS